MVFIFGEVIFSGMGWLYLFLRYWNLEKMAKVKDKEYEGSYSHVGRIMALRMVFLILILLLLGGIIAVVIGAIRNF